LSTPIKNSSSVLVISLPAYIDIQFCLAKVNMKTAANSVSFLKVICYMLQFLFFTTLFMITATLLWTGPTTSMLKNDTKRIKSHILLSGNFSPYSLKIA
jgi:hypothetical protein